MAQPNELGIYFEKRRHKKLLKTRDNRHNSYPILTLCTSTICFKHHDSISKYTIRITLLMLTF